ncbi:hypothetical protein ASPBRDRAFT_46266 [Aspergillus brasiliensis CBS 101740]|uniref:Uncharacterized protein n=1 Tax=Aspergillus brasiliensis (strain CBS 101740 / IMI 381727 / IBT 21946) TaxID=767769 RepID=A0A1L9UBD1_ASPBC|nr:hypothetical protein ASPBRDRAFT_46266 [Aspergillus brasiliensis CBS 101740]
MPCRIGLDPGDLVRKSFAVIPVKTLKPGVSGLDKVALHFGMLDNQHRIHTHTHTKRQFSVAEALAVPRICLTASYNDSTSAHLP